METWYRDNRRVLQSFGGMLRNCPPCQASLHGRATYRQSNHRGTTHGIIPDSAPGMERIRDGKQNMARAKETLHGGIRSPPHHGGRNIRIGGVPWGERSHNGGGRQQHDVHHDVHRKHAHRQQRQRTGHQRQHVQHYGRDSRTTGHDCTVSPNGTGPNHTTTTTSVSGVLPTGTAATSTPTTTTRANSVQYDNAATYDHTTTTHRSWRTWRLWTRQKRTRRRKRRTWWARKLWTWGIRQPISIPITTTAVHAHHQWPWWKYPTPAGIMKQSTAANTHQRAKSS